MNTVARTVTTRFLLATRPMEEPSNAAIKVKKINPTI